MRCGYESSVAAVTGLSSNFWSDLSVAVLCQSFYWQTSETRNEVGTTRLSLMSPVTITL